MRVLINTVPFYGKGAGLRTYTTQLLRAFHASRADMEWHVSLRNEDAEALGLVSDSRFHLTRIAPVSRPPRVPGVRFAWWNTIDQFIVPGYSKPEKYDLVHYLDSYGPAFRMPRIPYVLTVHDVIPLTGHDFYAGWTRRYLASLMRRTIPRAAAIMADSDTTAQALRDLLDIPSNRIAVALLGVDETFHPTSADERAEVLQRYHVTNPYIINVGTIEPRKNLVRLVHAFAQAKRHLDLPHHLLIAGKPKWKADDVTTAIDETGLSSAIHLLGFVPDEDIAPLIGGAHVLAYPSLEEGFGLPVIEGMACGVPVIASVNSPLAEDIGTAALLVDPLDVNAMATALGEICTNAEKRATMSAEGLARAQRYSWGHVADATLDMYHRAAGQVQARI